MNIEAYNYCIEKNIVIYPVTTSKKYTKIKQVGNKKIKLQLPYVKIEANLDGNKVLFNKEEYRQDDDDLYNVIHNLYNYYYERANK